MHIPVVASAPVSSETIVPTTATSTSLTTGPSAPAETAAGQCMNWYTEIWQALYYYWQIPQL